MTYRSYHISRSTDPQVFGGSTAVTLRALQIPYGRPARVETLGRPWGNHRETSGKWWFLMGLNATGKLGKIHGTMVISQRTMPS